MLPMTKTYAAWLAAVGRGGQLAEPVPEELGARPSCRDRRCRPLAVLRVMGSSNRRHANSTFSTNVSS